MKSSNTDKKNVRPSVRDSKRSNVIAKPYNTAKNSGRSVSIKQSNKIISAKKNSTKKDLSSIRVKPQNNSLIKNIVTPNKPKLSNGTKKTQDRPSLRTRNNENKISRTSRSSNKRDTNSKNKRNNLNFMSFLPRLKSKSEDDVVSSGKKKPIISKKIKTRSTIVAIALLVIIIGILAGIFTFILSTSSKLSIDNEAKSQLIKIQQNQPYYVLFCADIDESQDGCADMIFLSRVDPVSKQVIIISIPVDTYVASANGGGTTLAQISSKKDDAQLIQAVSAFCEEGITHYVRSNSDGILNLVDSLGGIEVDLKEHVDDPSVGKSYIPQGKSKINGEETLALLRSKKFSGGSTTISFNQRSVGKGLLSAALKKEINIPLLIDKLAGSIQTDMDVTSCIAFIDSLSNIEDSKILTTVVPGYKTMRNNNMVFIINASSWKNLRTQINYGSLPTDEEEKTIADINPQAFTISVRNGAGIDGAASLVAENLSKMGYNVKGTDNAEASLYTETLIVYKNKDYKGYAEAVKNSLNNGRIVDGEGLYTLNSDIMIIIGDDLKI